MVPEKKRFEEETPEGQRSRRKMVRTCRAQGQGLDGWGQQLGTYDGL